MCVFRYRAAFQERYHESGKTIRELLVGNLTVSQGSQARGNNHGFMSLTATMTGACAGSDHNMRERGKMCIFDTVSVRDMSLRQLRDTVQNFQFHWVKVGAVETMQPHLLDAVDALFHRFELFFMQMLQTCTYVFYADVHRCCKHLCIHVDALPRSNFFLHRFGVLASQGWSLGVLDDQGSIEKCGVQAVSNRPDGSVSSKWQNAVQGLSGSHDKRSGEDLVQLNRTCIRRFVNVFLSFYRSMHLWEIKQSVADSSCSTGGQKQEPNCGIRIHHVVAASDDFNKLSMHWDLMPAAKLNYVHDFRGYFNCISQVVCKLCQQSAKLCQRFTFPFMLRWPTFTTPTTSVGRRRGSGWTRYPGAWRQVTG